MDYDPNKQPAYNPNYNAPPPPYAGYPGPPSQGPGGPPPPGFNVPPSQGYGYQPPPQQYGYQPPPPIRVENPAPYAAAGGYGGYGIGGVEAGAPKFETGLGFDSTTIRRGFIRKVYLILMTQLLFVAGLVSVFTFEESCKLYIRRNIWIYIVSYVVFLISYISMVCCEGVRRRSPGNFICLAVITISIGFMTAMISSYHDTKIVFIGMGICAGVCLAISLFAINTKYDFTSLVGVMFVVFMVVFFFGIFAILFRSQIMMAVYGGIMALIFMVYLAIDTQMIIGGKKHEIDPEEYIFAATQLFLDIIYIFWFILQLLGFANRS